ncbi:MAG: hypothetical protein ACOYBJ_02205 [Patescibacteria group bacterium]|jgi:hypothetical protein
MNDGFTTTQLHQLKELFLEERSYTSAMVRDRLQPLEAKIDRLIEMETEDVHAIAKDVMRLDERVTRIEEHLATRA